MVKRIEVVIARLVLISALFLLPQNLLAIIIITYKKMDDIYQYRTDFSMASDRIDPILDIGDDDFSRQGPFGTNIGTPTATFKEDDFFTLSPSYDQNYLDYYYQTLAQPTNPLESTRDNFNLSSGASFQLSSFPNDFDITNDLFKPDPQLVSLIDYYINNIAITPGQKIVLSNSQFTFRQISKQNITFGGIVTALPISFLINCPEGIRVEWDIEELKGFSATTVTTSTKGCVGTNLNVLAIPT